MSATFSGIYLNGIVLSDPTTQNPATIAADASGGTLVLDESTAPTTGVQFSGPQLVLAEFSTNAGGWTSQNQFPRALGDVNGDGLADIVGFGAGGVGVALATGGGGFAQPILGIANFSASAGGWTSQDQYPRTLGDVNGDGLADIVGFGAGGVGVALANGDGTFAQPILGIANFGASAGGWTSQNQFPRSLGDVNGDGLDDIVGFGFAGTWVALATGGGSFAQPFLALDNFGFSADAGGWTSENQLPRAVADVNGDGLDDIVGFGFAGAYVSLATGGGEFAAPVLALDNFAVNAGGWVSQDQYPRVLADANGDGRADIVGFGENGVLTALGRADGTFDPPTFDFNNFGHSAAAGGWTSNNTFPRLAADVTGDNRADLVGFGFAGVFVAQSQDPSAFST